MLIARFLKSTSKVDNKTVIFNFFFVFRIKSCTPHYVIVHTLIVEKDFQIYAFNKKILCIRKIVLVWMLGCILSLFPMNKNILYIIYIIILYIYIYILYIIYYIYIYYIFILYLYYLFISYYYTKLIVSIIKYENINIQQISTVISR